MFPEERQEQRPQWLQEDRIYPSGGGYGGIRIPGKSEWEALPKHGNDNFIRQNISVIQDKKKDQSVVKQKRKPKLDNTAILKKIAERNIRKRSGRHFRED